MNFVSAKLSALSELTGRLTAWLMLPMVFGMFLIVVLRYAFDLGWIWMQESIVWMHAAVFMLAAAYTLKHDEHVRVDIFYRAMSPRNKAWVDLGGTLIFLLPMAIFLAAMSWDYVAVSWQIREGSREAGGLPYPSISLLKSLIPLTSVLLILQGIANLLSSAAMLLAPAGSREPVDPSSER